MVLLNAKYPTMVLSGNPFASQNNDELFFMLAIVGVCGIILLMGIFFASLYIERISANADSDVEDRTVTQADMSNLRAWCKSTINVAHEVNFDHMKQQREQIEDYVQERLREHFALLATKSPSFQGYGTFETPGGGTPVGKVRRGSKLRNEVPQGD